MDMPSHFWLLQYARVVWNRKLLAFVPDSILNKSSFEVMNDIWYLDENEGLRQIKELEALGLYGCKLFRCDNVKKDGEG